MKMFHDVIEFIVLFQRNDKKERALSSQQIFAEKVNERTTVGRAAAGGRGSEFCVIFR